MCRVAIKRISLPTLLIRSEFLYTHLWLAVFISSMPTETLHIQRHTTEKATVTSSSNTSTQGAGKHSHCPLTRVQLLVVHIFPVVFNSE